MQGGGVAGCLKLGHKMQIPRIRLNDFDYLKRNSNSNNSNKNNKSSNKSNNKQKRGKKPVKRPRGAGGGERED